MVIEGNFYKNSYLIQRNFTQISYPIREFSLKKTPNIDGGVNLKVRGLTGTRGGL